MFSPFAERKQFPSGSWVNSVLHSVGYCLDTRSHDTRRDKYKTRANWHACNLRVQGFGRRSGMGCKALCLAQGCCSSPRSLRFMPIVGSREHQQCRVFQMHSWCLHRGWRWHTTQETTSIYSKIFPIIIIFISLWVYEKFRLQKVSVKIRSKCLPKRGGSSISI